MSNRMATFCFPFETAPKWVPSKNILYHVPCSLQIKRRNPNYKGGVSFPRFPTPETKYARHKYPQRYGTCLIPWLPGGCASVRHRVLEAHTRLMDTELSKATTNGCGWAGYVASWLLEPRPRKQANCLGCQNADTLTTRRLGGVFPSSNLFLFQPLIAVFGSFSKCESLVLCG